MKFSILKTKGDSSTDIALLAYSLGRAGVSGTSGFNSMVKLIFNHLWHKGFFSTGT
ncbi:hypothetical protein ACJX0J_006982, partial [Zea mays]